jgi:hypothetical protein
MFQDMNIYYHVFYWTDQQIVDVFFLTSYMLYINAQTAFPRVCQKSHEKVCLTPVSAGLHLRQAL